MASPCSDGPTPYLHLSIEFWTVNDDCIVMVWLEATEHNAIFAN